MPVNVRLTLCGQPLHGLIADGADTVHAGIPEDLGPVNASEDVLF